MVQILGFPCNWCRTPLRINSAPRIFSSKLMLWATTQSDWANRSANCSKTGNNGCPSAIAVAVVMPWMSEATLGIVEPSGAITWLPWSSHSPLASKRTHANCTMRGQLSTCVTGAFQSLGNPVVSVSKIRYISVFRIWGFGFRNTHYTKRQLKSSNPHPLVEFRHRNIEVGSVVNALTIHH